MVAVDSYMYSFPPDGAAFSTALPLTNKGPIAYPRADCSSTLASATTKVAADGPVIIWLMYIRVQSSVL